MPTKPDIRRELAAVPESPLVQIATLAESMPGSIKLCYGESDLPIAAKVHDLHGVKYDGSEIMVTGGASMAIYAAIRAGIGPGDNAVIISPAYAIYANGVTMCGGEPRFAPLARSGAGFVLDLDRVRDAIDGLSLI